MAEECLENPALQSNLNRPSKDKFLLVFNLPKIFKDAAITDKNLDLESVQLSIYGGIVPPISVPPVELRFAGQSVNISSHSRPAYPPLNVNFIIDNQFKNYWVLWKWLALMNTPRESIYDVKTPTSMKPLDSDSVSRNGLLTEYQTILSVIGLNEYNQRTIEFRYYNAFITNLAGINYNYRDSEILESSVEFTFGQLDVFLSKN
jgi:hypothetical protein